MSGKNKTVVGGFNEINQKISDAINTQATEGAVSISVEKRLAAEKQKRADLLEKGLEKYNTTLSSLKSLQPDVVTFAVVTDGNNSETGNALQSKAYSAKAWKQKQEAEKLVSDLELAIAFIFSDKLEEVNKGYTSLQKLVGNGGGEQKNKSTE